jgi:protoporphyrinogen oxidase
MWVGLKGAFDHDHHWTYFPGKESVFYRTGYISNYAQTMAPEGCSSLIAEVARRPDEPAGEGLEGRVVDDLVRAGVVKRAGDVVLVKPVRIDPAYVIFDRARRAALPVLFDYLMRNRIMPIGRYGAWNYLGMEDSILHGMQAANRLRIEAATGG